MDRDSSCTVRCDEFDAMLYPHSSREQLDCLHTATLPVLVERPQTVYFCCALIFVAERRLFFKKKLVYPLIDVCTWGVRQTPEVTDCTKADDSIPFPSFPTHTNVLCCVRLWKHSCRHTKRPEMIVRQQAAPRSLPTVCWDTNHQSQDSVLSVSNNRLEGLHHENGHSYQHTHNTSSGTTSVLSACPPHSQTSHVYKTGAQASKHTPPSANT